MKKILLPCFVFLLTNSAFAQTKKPNPLDAKVIAAAKQMDNALVKKDYATFMKTVYPQVISNTEGGAERMEKELQAQLEGMEKSGNSITAAWPGKPSKMIDTAGEMQCTLPQFMNMKLPNGMLTTETTLICLSPDKGNTWYFIDATDKPLEQWRTVFPNISCRLEIPKPKEPKFEATEEIKKEMSKRK